MAMAKTYYDFFFNLYLQLEQLPVKDHFLFTLGDPVGDFKTHSHEVLYSISQS